MDFRRKGFRFPYRGTPKHVKAACGDLLFIASHGFIVGVAPILGIDPIDPNDDMEYLEQGKPNEPELYRYIRVGKMTQLNDGPLYKGHMGIRYVDRLSNPKTRKYLQAKARLLRPTQSAKK
jgi:hypothetical protein